MAAGRESSCAVTAIGISPSFLILGFVGPTQAAASASTPHAISAAVLGDGGHVSSLVRFVRFCTYRYPCPHIGI
jgi:hypothetical protein